MTFDMTKLKGAIFDADGTMLDSMHIWQNLAGDYLVSRGIVPQADLNEVLLGMGGHEIPEYFKLAYGLDETIAEIQLGFHKLLENFYFHHAPVKKGVIAVLDALRERGIKMCVATATDRQLIEPALRRCGLLDYFGRIFTCSEEQTSKTSPDIYIRAASYLGTRIGETLVFEDALYAVESANGAGFPVVGVYDLYSAHNTDRIKALSDYYCISMDEFLPML